MGSLLGGRKSLVRDVKGRAGEGSEKRAYCRCTCLLLMGRWRSTLEYGGWVRGRLTDRSDDLSYFVLEGFGSISKNALSQDIPLEVACIAGVKWLRPRSLKGTSYLSIYLQATTYCPMPRRAYTTASLHRYKRPGVPSPLGRL